jgi:uncharacterized protein (TIGR02145 family)
MGWYDKDNANLNKFGGFYNWYAVNTGKLCPEGWRVPNDNDWNTLIQFVGGNGVAGGKLKEKGTVNWISPNEGATDEFGFKALPAGCHNTMTYMGINNTGFFWSSKEAADPAFASHFYINTWTAEMMHFPQAEKKSGFSVRCIKN